MTSVLLAVLSMNLLVSALGVACLNCQESSSNLPIQDSTSSCAAYDTCVSSWLEKPHASSAGSSSSLPEGSSFYHSVRLSIMDSARRPARASDVWVFQQDNEAAWSIYAYFLGLNADTHSFLAPKGSFVIYGYNSIAAGYTYLNSDQDTHASLTLRISNEMKKHRVTLKVVDEERKEVSGASIRIHRVPSEAIQLVAQAATSDIGGSASFELVDVPFMFRAEIERKGSRYYGFAATVADKDRLVELVLRRVVSSPSGPGTTATLSPSQTQIPNATEAPCVGPGTGNYSKPVATGEVGGIAAISVPTQATTASYSRHIMCKDWDASWNPVNPTTVFSPSDSKSVCLTTVTISTSITFKWYYRTSSKTWTLQTTSTWNAPSSGTYYVAGYLWIAGYWPGSNYPLAWAIEVYLDGSFYFNEYFEVTNGGLYKNIMCESVDGSGNPVNEKYTFVRGVDSRAYHYVRYNYIAYFNAGTGHCHDLYMSWIKPDNTVDHTNSLYWPDYPSGSNYWGWGYVPNDYLTIDSSTQLGQWKVDFYLDQYYEGASKWYFVGRLLFTISTGGGCACGGSGCSTTACPTANACGGKGCKLSCGGAGCGSGQGCNNNCKNAGSSYQCSGKGCRYSSGAGCGGAGCGSTSCPNQCKLYGSICPAPCVAAFYKVPMPQILNQGGYGSCVGHATATTAMWWECGKICYQGVGDSDTRTCSCTKASDGSCSCISTYLSRQYLYDRSRLRWGQDCRVACISSCPCRTNPHPTTSFLTTDCMEGGHSECKYYCWGSFCYAAAWVLANEGVCTETCHPYGNYGGCTNGGSSGACPSTGSCSNCGLRYRKRSDDPTNGYTTLNGVDAIKDAIRHRGIVLTSFSTCTGCSPPSDSFCVCTSCSCSYGGGHAIVLYGYDDTNHRFLIQNSWGTSWGTNGRGYISYGIWTGGKGYPGYHFGGGVQPPPCTCGGSGCITTTCSACGGTGSCGSYGCQASSYCTCSGTYCRSASSSSWPCGRSKGSCSSYGCKADDPKGSCTCSSQVCATYPALPCGGKTSCVGNCGVSGCPCSGLSYCNAHKCTACVGVQYVLHVQSSPVTGVAIVWMIGTGSQTGYTNFNIGPYSAGFTVTLTAPATQGACTFSYWTLDGANMASTLSLTVTVDASHNERTAIAVYAWSSWSVIPQGLTDAAPAIAFFNSRLYVAVKGKGTSEIWLNSMDPATLVWIGWTKLDGATPSSPVLTASSSHLYLAVRGTNDQVYWRSRTSGSSFS